MKKYLLSLFAVIATTFASLAEDTAAYTCEFKKDYFGSKTSGYTTTWTTICNGNKWTIANFHNNNSSWDYIRCGRNGNPSVASITTDFAAPEKIGKVVVTIDAITAAQASYLKSIKLESSATSDFSTVEETVDITKAAGKQTAELTHPAANLYYRLVFDCASAKANGFVQVSKVEYFATQSSTTDPDKEEITLGWSPKSTSLTIGDEFTAPTLTGKPEDAIVEYSSDNSDLLSVDPTTGEMTFTPGVLGTAKITAKISDSDPKYHSLPVVYTLTVSKEAVTLNFEQAAYTAELGSEFTSPVLTVNPEAARNEVVFTSSNPNVATVSADGTVAITGAGATTITATIKDNATYADATAKYTLTVSDPNNLYDNIVFDNLNFTDKKTAPTNIKHGIVTITLDKGNNTTAPAYYSPELRVYKGNTMTISVPEGYILTKIESVYGSSGKSIVSVTSGTLNSDYTTWTATDKTNTVTFSVSEDTRKWVSLTVHYAKIKDKEDVTLTFTDGSEDMEVEFADGKTVQGHVATASVSGLSISYSSSDPEVATVDGNGLLTLTGIGTTVITASTAETAYYNSAEVHYTLTVKEKTIILGEIMANSQPLANNDEIDIVFGTPIIFSAENADKISYEIIGDNDFREEDSTEGSTIICKALDPGLYSATVKAEMGSINKEVEVMINVKKVPTLSFSSTAVTVNEDEEFTAPTLTTDPDGLEETYTSSNEAVATIIDNEVTLTGAAGTTVITATFAGNDEYVSASASYTLTVVPSSGSVTFDFNTPQKAVYGLTPQTGSNDYETAVTHIGEGIVSIDFTGKFRLWQNDWTLRVHSGASMNISVPNNYYITGITFTGTSAGLETTVGSFASSKWEPTETENLSKVQFTRSGTANLKTIKVSFSKKSPEIKGITFNDPIENEEARELSVYYVLHVMNHTKNTNYTVNLTLKDENGNAKSDTITVTDHNLFNDEFTFVAPRRGVSHELADGATHRLQGVATFTEFPYGTELTHISVQHAVNDKALSEEQTVAFDTPITTGITEVNAADGAATVEWYDLSGRHVASPAKGVYLMKQGTKVTKRAL